MYYPVYEMVHIKETLLLIRKSSPCGSSMFPFSLFEWSFTVCPMPYTINVLSAANCLTSSYFYLKTDTCVCVCVCVCFCTISIPSSPEVKRKKEKHMV